MLVKMYVTQYSKIYSGMVDAHKKLFKDLTIYNHPDKLCKLIYSDFDYLEQFLFNYLIGIGIDEEDLPAEDLYKNFTLFEVPGVLHYGDYSWGGNLLGMFYNVNDGTLYLFGTSKNAIRIIAENDLDDYGDEDLALEFHPHLSMEGDFCTYNGRKELLYRYLEEENYESLFLEVSGMFTVITENDVYRTIPYVEEEIVYCFVCGQRIDIQYDSFIYCSTSGCGNRAHAHCIDYEDSVSLDTLELGALKLYCPDCTTKNTTQRISYQNNKLEFTTVLLPESLGAEPPPAKCHFCGKENKEPNDLMNNPDDWVGIGGELSNYLFGQKQTLVCWDCFQTLITEYPTLSRLFVNAGLVDVDFGAFFPRHKNYRPGDSHDFYFSFSYISPSNAKSLSELVEFEPSTEHYFFALYGGARHTSNDVTLELFLGKTMLDPADYDLHSYHPNNNAVCQSIILSDNRSFPDYKNDIYISSRTGTRMYIQIPLAMKHYFNEDSKGKTKQVLAEQFGD